MSRTGLLVFSPVAISFLLFSCAKALDRDPFNSRLYMSCEDNKSVVTFIEAGKKHPTKESHRKTWNVMISLPTGEMTIDGKKADLQVGRDQIEGNIYSLSENAYLRTESKLRFYFWRDRFPAFRVEESPLEMERINANGSSEAVGFDYYEHEGNCEVIG